MLSILQIFDKYFYVQSTFPRAVVIVMNKIDERPYPHGAHIILEKDIE